MKNLKLVALYLLAGYIVPLLPKPALIGHYKIWILMLSCIVMLSWANPPVAIKKEDQKISSDKGTLLLILVLGFMAVLAPVFEWAYFKTALSWTAWTTTGVLLITGGLWFRIWSLSVLGKYFTSVVQKIDGHQLVTAGPYQWLRHPSYLGSLVAFCGCAVLLEAWIGLIVCFSAMAIAYFFRITTEEKVLLTIFGNTYKEYQEKTWALLPYIW